MRNKVCLVTGATSGIGLETARELARLGATVVVVGRNPDKCRTVVETIRHETGNPLVECLLANLSSQKQIHRLADQFARNYRQLDVLVNNAGARFMTRQESADGIEMTLTLNHLGYFLLTLLLVDILKASAPARIINVASEAHRGKVIDFEDLQSNIHYNGREAYGRSKLANLMFTYELSRRLEGTRVTVNALHPGVVATNLDSNNGPLAYLYRRLSNIFLISPHEGAQTGIFLATGPEVEGVTGKYYYRKQVIPSSGESYDELAAIRLWDRSARLTKLPAEAAI